jgi:multimeric flavodoxin WrbA
MGKRFECFDQETVEKITGSRFDEIDNIEECYERFMERCAEMIIETEVEMIKHKDKCRKLKKYTPDDLKTAMRFYNCILCSLNSFM